MIRVGFILQPIGDGWLGGMSYYRNLFSAIREMPSRQIEPVLISSARNYSALARQFPGLPIIHSSLLDLPFWIDKARRGARSIMGRDFFLERVLKPAKVDVLSHSGYLGSEAKTPSIVWIPDFQELSFPEFFSDQEIADRKRNAINCARHSSTLMFSSRSALADFKTINERSSAVEVLQFVTALPSDNDFVPSNQIKAEYEISGKFFHLPNQFWVHKNHQVVLEALALLRREGRDLVVISTGNKEDHRQPKFFSSLMEQASDLGVGDLFRPLGIIPYAHLMSLMRHSVGIINPSKFEGWSTTVEEGKSMGKEILLSDIPVHREQAPLRGLYFNPQDHRRLAEHMLSTWDGCDPEVEEARFREARECAPERRGKFAKSYEGIVLSTVERHKSCRRV